MIRVQKRSRLWIVSRFRNWNWRVRSYVWAEAGNCSLLKNRIQFEWDAIGNAKFHSVASTRSVNIDRTLRRPNNGVNPILIFWKVAVFRAKKSTTVTNGRLSAEIFSHRNVCNHRDLHIWKTMDILFRFGVHCWRGFGIQSSKVLVENVLCVAWKCLVFIRERLPIFRIYVWHCWLSTKRNDWFQILLIHVTLNHIFMNIHREFKSYYYDSYYLFYYLYKNTTIERFNQMIINHKKITTYTTTIPLKFQNVITENTLDTHNYFSAKQSIDRAPFRSFPAVFSHFSTVDIISDDSQASV